MAASRRNISGAAAMEADAHVGKIPGKLSVVMPGFNEGSHICQNLLTTADIVSSFTEEYEIVFVNDGSRDNTLEQAHLAARQNSNIRVIEYAKNSGKGHALKVGVEKATGDFIAFLDSDLELWPSQLQNFYRLMDEQNADVIIGSKLHPNSVSNYPVQRRIISFGYYWGLKILFQLNVKDTQTGLKLFKADVIKPVMRLILVKKFAYDIEVLAVINKEGHKIAEAPVELSFSREQKWGRIRLKDVWDVLIDTLAIFYRLNILKYYKVNREYTGKKEEVLVNTKTLS